MIEELDTFKSNTDTEVLLTACEWGIKSFLKFNDVCFAIWDKHKKELN